MKSTDDFDIENKTVLVRIDINSPIVHGQVQDNRRIEKSAETLQNLSSKGAKVIAIGHQGRPGREDFTHLDHHGELLSKYISKNITYVQDIIGKKAEKTINNLKQGDILLLDNLRMCKEELKKVLPEKHSKSKLVKKLSTQADIYVNDAFSVCHRNHASITGFPQVMPSAGGPVLQDEIKALKRMRNPQPDVLYVLGGNKPEDAIDILVKQFGEDRINFALLGGVIGEVFLQIKGIDLGKKEHTIGKGLKNKISGLLGEYGNFIYLPKDVAYVDEKRKELPVSELPIDEKIFDIGTKTVKEFAGLIDNANTIVMNGTLGKVENDHFQKGTKEVLWSIANTKGFSLLGGGDTNRAIKVFGFKEEQFSHVSLAGGAFVSYLGGENLPGLDALS